jgi:hypothetical protein
MMNSVWLVAPMLPDRSCFRSIVSGRLRATVCAGPSHCRSVNHDVRGRPAYSALHCARNNQIQDVVGYTLLPQASTVRDLLTTTSQALPASVSSQRRGRRVRFIAHLLSARMIGELQCQQPCVTARHMHGFRPLLPDERNNTKCTMTKKTVSISATESSSHLLHHGDLAGLVSPSCAARTMRPKGMRSVSTLND